MANIAGATLTASHPTTRLSRHLEKTEMDTSYLTTQVTTIISQLHGLFDEIGVPSNEIESREAEVSELQSNPRAIYTLEN